ncbi:MAG: cytochrome c biogenesis protein CcsA [Bacteroidetes bacterium]|nr:cytochrome c biogenesis protein CcsA [Bacteroidota bacterium]
MRPLPTWLKWSLAVWMAAILVIGWLMPIPKLPVLGETARNIYFHVPQAFTMIFMLVISFWNSYRFLKSGNLNDDLKAESAASVGMLFGITTIITGAIWADFTWGVYWNWDPKQTLFLGLLLIYAAYFVLRLSVDDPHRKAKLSAGYNLFSFLVMPFLVFVIPRLLPGLHPGAPEDDGANNPVVSGIELSIRILLYSSFIGFGVLAYWLYNLRYRLARIARHING